MINCYMKDCENYGRRNLIYCYDDCVKKYKAKIDRYKKALEFYANAKHCVVRGKRLMCSDCYVGEDGFIARKALKEVK